MIPYYTVLSEQKIDDIARDISGIKLLLQGLNVDENQPIARSAFYLNQAESVKPQIERQSISAPPGEPLWEHSAHIIDFIKAVLEERGSRDVGPEAIKMLSSLRMLVQALEDPAPARSLFVPRAIRLAKHQANPPMLSLWRLLLRYCIGRKVCYPGNACFKFSNMNIRSRAVYKNRLAVADTSSSKRHRDLPKGILRSG